ncbi:MAG: holo-ACP synthase [Thermodesulfobacteriaceae bacterium]|nr:holo-ACP synthase [Thermodesulfobacteriaceae bacterium]
MNPLRLGTDLVYIPRIERLISQYGDRFLNKIFTSEEIEYALKRVRHAFHLASAFSVKEAFFKAVGGYSPFSWKEVVLKREPSSGAPFLELRGKALEVFKSLSGNKIVVSLSHERDYVIGIVLIY